MDERRLELPVSVQFLWDAVVLRAAVAVGLLGLGATVASFLSAVPWLVALSRHKGVVFLVAGVLIGGNLAYVYVVGPPVG